MIAMMLSNSGLRLKLPSEKQMGLGFFTCTVYEVRGRHGRPQVCKNRIDAINPVLTYSSVCQTYPWRVAPQQSPFPFRFDEAKIITFSNFRNYFVFFKQKVGNLKKILLPLPKNCKVISGRNQNCKVLLGRSQKNCKVFLGRDTLCNSVCSPCNSL